MPAERKRRMSPEDVAELDRLEYDEPGRDLLATRPSEPGEGGGATGDVDAPRAEEGVPGSMGKTEDTLGSDENASLAKGKRA